MVFTAVSQHPLPTHAAGEVIGAALEAPGPRPDLVVLAVTGPFAGALDDIDATVRELLEPRMLISVATASVLTGDGPIVDAPAVVLFGADWGGRLRHGPRGTRTIGFGSEPDGGGWRVRGSDALEGADGHLLLFVGDPEFPTEPFLDELRERSPELIVSGGTPTPPAEPTMPGLIVDGRRIESGAAGILLPRGVPVRTVVSQGTRPVGSPYVVTSASPGLIRSLAGRPALERVLEETQGAAPEDRRALAREMNLGLVLTERDGPPLSGDVLVRRLPGADRGTGALAIDGFVEVGTTVQLQARDRRSAEDDLHRVLTGEPAAGALVFADHRRSGIAADLGERDAAVLAAHVGPRRVAGIGCTGVIGPVGSRSWIHRSGVAAALFDGG